MSDERQINRTRRAKLVTLRRTLLPLILFALAVELIDRRRDDDHMPTTHARRVDIEKMYSLPTAWTISISNFASYPLIVESGLIDIQEGLLNGPEGFAYFAAAPARKTGALPETLGGESGWSTDAWASNFQGPVKVQGKTEHV